MSIIIENKGAGTKTYIAHHNIESITLIGGGPTIIIRTVSGKEYTKSYETIKICQREIERFRS